MFNNDVFSKVHVSLKILNKSKVDPWVYGPWTIIYEIIRVACELTLVGSYIPIRYIKPNSSKIWDKTTTYCCNNVGYVL